MASEPVRGRGSVALPRLRALREDKLMTQEDLARASGVSRFTVARTERGEPARYSTIRKLATALGIQPAELVGSADEGKALAA
jgi:transcriptional regulator with XRE-family HTH domain